MATFLDRRDAGRQLAAKLDRYRDQATLVVALPRGGVPVGDEVARALDAELDVLVARKLGAPGNPEFAIGAIAPGVTWLEESTVRTLAVPRDYISSVIAREEAEMRRREEAFRPGRPPLEVAGRTVILVDDGLATGATAIAAIESLRRRKPRALVLAVPVGSSDTIAALRPRVDELVCLDSPLFFRAVGQAYVDFAPTTDHEVLEILRGRHVEVAEGDL
jgi:putative phosphoribosyl transferase